MPAAKPGPSNNHEQREREPDPAPACSALGQVIPLAAKTGAPDQLPATWIEAGRLLRPNLPVEAIERSGAIFLDHHRAKGTQLVNWLPVWRNWLCRERAPPSRRPGLNSGLRISEALGLKASYATNLLDAGAERVDIQALLGHESIATTQIDTHVGQERMEKVVARL